jgi:hypothetical protein
MTTYMIDYLWNGTSTHVKGVITESHLAEIKDHPKHVILSLNPHTPVIRYQTAEGCERCTYDEFVPHHNCHCGANRAHCTSDYCF